MAILKPSEIRALTPKVRAEKLKEIQDELMHERGLGAMGGAPKSPGKIRALRKIIARILTIQRETEILNSEKSEASK